MLAYRRALSVAVRSTAGKCRGAAANEVDSRGVLGLGSSSSSSIRLFSSLPDHAVVGMPALSPTMTHGNMGAWGKQVGDEIAAGDVVCEVETDKATVDFDAQDDSIMAKHLVEAGTQDIPVGTPIFVTVEEAGDVDAFKDFTLDAEAAPAAEDSNDSGPAEEKEKEETPAPAPTPAPSPAPAPAPAASPAPAPEAPAPKPETEPVEEKPKPEKSSETSDSSATSLVFKRDWGSGVNTSPLAHRLSAEQRKYVERFGPTLQQPADL